MVCMCVIFLCCSWRAVVVGEVDFFFKLVNFVKLVLVFLTEDGTIAKAEFKEYYKNVS